jgi:hypothetical protein
MFDLPMSRTDMVNDLGCTTETVCRVLAHLRRDGSIVIERGGIEIRDTVVLQQMASGRGPERAAPRGLSPASAPRRLSLP